MKQKLLLMILIILLSQNVYSQKYDPVVLNSAHVRTLKSDIVENMQYELCIALPEGYNDTTLTYPVAYLLDGYELFGLQLQTYQQLVFHKHVPKLILVSINYNFGDKEFYAGLTDYEYFRFRDYTPTEMTNQQLIEKYGKTYASYVDQSGGSEKFLRFIQKELIPFIESEYRANPNNRSIFGYSQGGLFTTYILFHSPETFHKIFIGSPALWWDDEIIFTYYDEKKFESLKNPVRVYMSIGELEGSWLQESFKKLNNFITDQKNHKIEIISEIFPGEKHLTGIGLAHSRAFRRLYE